MKTECSAPNRPVLIGYSKTDSFLYMYQPRCKMWKCPSCADLNRSMWCAKVGEGINVYQSRGIEDWMFVTITSHQKARSWGYSRYVWPKAWAKLSARMRRKFKGIRYVLLPEQHNDGTLHIHAIASHGMTTRWLKDNAPSCGLGYMSESDEIENADNAISYVFKYVTKSIELTDWPSRFRRIRTNQKWPPLVDQDDFDGFDIGWKFYTTCSPEDLDGVVLLAEMDKGCKIKILK